VASGFIGSRFFLDRFLPITQREQSVSIVPDDKTMRTFVYTFVSAGHE